MPQLDIITFPAQVFTLFIVFFIYLLIVQKNILPTISRMIGIRSFFLESSKDKSLVFINESASFKERKVNSFNNTTFSTEACFNNLSGSLETERSALYNSVLINEKVVNSTWLSNVSSS